MTADRLSFSIITPSYNRGSFIEDTIRSVLGQWYGNLTYLVVDGRSNDDTLETLKEYKSDSRFDFISEPDGGMYDAINKGLARARGDIFAYINTDDRYFPWTLKVVHDFFRLHPEADIVYGDSMVVEESVRRPRFNFYPRFNEDWLRAGGIISQPTVFFRKRVYDELGGFSRDAVLIADCEDWLRAVDRNMKFAKLNEILAIEFNHGTTLRNTRRSEILAEKRRLLAAYPPSPLLRSKICRVGMMRMKYFEKELLALRFLHQAKKRSFPCRKRPWNHYLSHYRVKTDIVRHFLQKITRQTQSVCEIMQP